MFISAYIQVLEEHNKRLRRVESSAVASDITTHLCELEEHDMRLSRVDRSALASDIISLRETSLVCRI
jgi:hypothetical protein